MRIVLYTADAWTHVCPTMRVLSPARELGVEVIAGYQPSSTKIEFLPEKVNSADVVVLQRDFPRYRSAYEQVIKMAKAGDKPIIYDLDDLLLELPGVHPDFTHYTPARSEILQAILEADQITCPTQPLANYLRRFNTNVTVLPNYLDDTLWRKALHRESLKSKEHHSPLTIGYMGGYNHIPDVEMIEPVLIPLLRLYGDKIKIRFWGCPPPPELQGWKNVEWIKLGLVDYAQFANYFSEQTCDIFIAPLTDTPFNQAKSSIKFLEYSILNVPGIYSHIAPYADIITNGENGFLAQDLEDWREYLVRLIEDPELRWTMGNNARATTEKKLLSKHAQEWLDVYEHVRPSPLEVEISREVLHHTLHTLLLWRDEDYQQISLLQNTNSIVWKKSRTDVETAEKWLEKKQQLINEILASPGWKLVTLLGAIRAKVIPPGGHLERFLVLGKKVLERIWGRIRKQTLAEKQALGLTTESLQTPKREPTSKFPPFISIIAIKTDAMSVDLGSLQEWLSNQTISTSELIIWERGIAQAYPYKHPEDSWDAQTTQELVQNINGRYICIASSGLLLQPETFLESNLIALEGENLIFTINWQGDYTEIVKWLRVGLIPMTGEPPRLPKTPCVYIMRKENLGGFTTSSFPGIKIETSNQLVKVGKIITYPTGEAKPSKGILPGPEIQLKDNRLHVLGNDILLVSPQSDLSTGTITSTARSLRVIGKASSVKGTHHSTILVVMPFLAVGGAERVALEVMYQLQNDIRFVLVTVEQHSPSLGTMIDLFRQVTPYIYTSFDWLSPQSKLSFLQYIIEKFSPDTMYIANGAEWIYNTVKTIKQQYPELRIVNQVYDHHVGWINRYDKDLATYIDAHIGCNENICAAYKQRGVPDKNVYLVPHGIDTQQFDPSRYTDVLRRSIKEQMGLPIETRIITFMARIHPQKRPLDFVELARHFTQWPNLTFLMAGDGPLTGTIDATVIRMKLKNLVRRPFSPATDLLAISDVLVLPSEYEGMPMVILEAQSMGKPVVVTDVGNTREILDITQGGVLVETIGDIQALAHGVEQMLDAPPDPETVRQAVIDHFDVRKVAASYRRTLLGES